MGLWRIGNEINVGATHNYVANYKLVCKFQNTSGYDLTVSRAIVILRDNYAGSKGKVVVYSDNAGSPDALLYVSDEKIGWTVNANVATFSSPFTFTNGSYLWFGVQSDTTMGASCPDLAGGAKYNTDSYADGPTDPFGSASTLNSVYPIWLEGDDGEDTIGRVSVLPQSTSFTNDKEYFDKFTVDEEVSIASIQAYVSSTSETVNGKAAIYSDDGGVPDALVAQSSEITGVSADSWQEFPISATLSAATYWIGIVFDESIDVPYSHFDGFGIRSDESEASAFSDPYHGTDYSFAPDAFDFYLTLGQAAIGIGGSLSFPSAAEISRWCHYFRTVEG